MNAVVEQLGAEIERWNVAELKQDMIRSNVRCNERGLHHSAKWAAEMIYAFSEVSSDETVTKPCTDSTTEGVQDFECYTLAKAYFDLEEYDRAAHFTRSCTSACAYFLHIYAQYRAGEKRKVDDTGDENVPGPPEFNSNAHLERLRSELELRHKTGQLDGFALYLYGVVLRKLDVLKEAVEALLEAVRAEPLHWGAWKELSLLITDKDMLLGLSLPTHWMRYVFYAQVCVELQLNDEALRLYSALSERLFKRSTYMIAQRAIAFHNTRNVDEAVEMFARLKRVDPYRLENMDTYSNLLYVKEMRAEMANLAHECCDIDKYRVETCCVIGNYYSLRGQHEKAVLYFQRALKLNPSYLAAWTLMGHEYMELKHTAAAIQAYRQAIEVNRRDYRAWYGLGQTYEILKMPYYCLYYYKQAQMLRPNDSRMVVALGDAYDKLERLQEAKKCYYKAHSIGDMEGLALVKLARLYEKLMEEDQAASAYTEYINESAMSGLGENCDEQAHAYKYLANYHLKHSRLEEAFYSAQKCTDFNETREEGKALLRQISRLRALVTEGVSPEGAYGGQVEEGGGPVGPGWGGGAQGGRPDPQDTPGTLRMSPISYLTFTP